MLELSSVKYKHLSERLGNTIETGLLDYDRHTFDWKPGEITILVARDGEGKSTLIFQVIAHVINNGHKVYLYNGELSNSKLQEWFYRQVIGSDEKYYQSVKTKYGIKQDFNPSVIALVKEWHRNKLYTYDMSMDKIRKNTTKLFDDMLSARKLGCELFVVDNLMTAYEINQATQNADQANFIQHCKDFARDNDAHVVILVHPNKERAELSPDDVCGNLTKKDISGTGMIAQKADNILALERIWKVKGIEYDTHIPDAYLTSLKDRQDGVRAMFKYWFNPNTLRFYNYITPIIGNIDWQGTGNQINGFTEIKEI